MCRETTIFWTFPHIAVISYPALVCSSRALQTATFRAAPLAPPTNNELQGHPKRARIRDDRCEPHSSPPVWMRKQIATHSLDCRHRNPMSVVMGLSGLNTSKSRFSMAKFR
jgi:hypothetical protein